MQYLYIFFHEAWEWISEIATTTSVPTAVFWPLALLVAFVAVQKQATPKIVVTTILAIECARLIIAGLHINHLSVPIWLDAEPYRTIHAYGFLVFVLVATFSAFNKTKAALYSVCLLLIVFPLSSNGNLLASWSDGVRHLTHYNGRADYTIVYYSAILMSRVAVTLLLAMSFGWFVRKLPRSQLPISLALLTFGSGMWLSNIFPKYHWFTWCGYLVCKN